MRKKKVKKITIKELQSYITGAIELNIEGWHPDGEQWEKIVDMIMHVKVESPSVQQVIVERKEQSGGTTTRGGGVFIEEPMLDEDGNPVRSASKTDMRSNPTERVANMGEKNSEGVISSGIINKTKNIDTSKGEYQSDF